MSLINQMLRDLEQRSEGPVLEQQDVLRGLGSSDRATAVAEKRGSWLLYGFLVLLAVACSFLLLERFGVLMLNEGTTLAEANEKEQTLITTIPASVSDTQAPISAALPEWRDTGEQLEYELLPVVSQTTTEKQFVATEPELETEPGPIATTSRHADMTQLHGQIKRESLSIEARSGSDTELAGVLVGDSQDPMHWDALQTKDDKPQTDRVHDEQKHSGITQSQKRQHEQMEIMKDVVASEEPVQQIDTGESAFSRTPAVKKDRELALEHYQKALQQLRRKRQNQAIDSLKLALSLDQKLSDARVLLATQLLAQGHSREAEEVLVNGLQLQAKDAVVAHAYARILVAGEKISGALNILQGAAPRIELNPDYHAFTAALLQRSGDHREAINKYTEVLKIKPAQGVWWMGLGISLQAEGLQRRALQAFQTALRDNSLSTNIRQYLSDRISVLQGATS